MGTDGVIALCEDETGEVEFVTFGFVDARSDVADWLPIGRMFILKELFFGDASRRHVALAVNSPSDVVWVRATSPAAGSWQVARSGSFDSWWRKGALAFANSKNNEALRCWGLALDFGEDANIQCGRTAALGRLGRFAEAVEIARRTAERWPVASTFSRLAKCLLDARMWREALDYYQRVVDHGDKSYIPDVEICQRHLAEEILCSFSWDGIAWKPSHLDEEPDDHAGPDAKVPKMPVADYNGGVEVRSAGDLGLGTFATRDFEKGEVVRVEKAIICETASEILKSGMVLDVHAFKAFCGATLLAQAFIGNPRIREDLYRLDGVRPETMTRAKTSTGQSGWMHVNGKVGMPDVPPPPEGVFDMLRL